MTKLERNKSIYECHKEGITQQTIGKIFSLGYPSNVVEEIV